LVPIPESKLFYFRIIELGALNARGGTGAFNRGYLPKAGQPFGRKGLNDFPAPFELIDIGDELEDLRRNNDVPDVVHYRNTQFHPILPNSHPKARTTQFHPISPASYPIRLRLQVTNRLIWRTLRFD
jgi:hypothetical protein